MKRIMVSFLVILGGFVNLEGCSDHSSRGGGGSGSTWQPVASMPDDGVDYQGFGVRSNGEFVLAGGRTDRITGAMTSQVVFYQAIGGALTPVRTAFLPKVMIRPAIEEINGSLYIFDGGSFTSQKPAPVRDVYRYDDANNSFVSESPDPGFFFYNYAGRYQNQLFSLNPPESFSTGLPGTQTLPATLQRFTPGVGWTSFQLASFPGTGNVAVVGSTAYAFNGYVTNVGPNTKVFAIGMENASVNELPLTTLLRESGTPISIVVNGLIHLHGPGLDQTPEVFDPVTNQVTVRSDLGAPEPLDRVIVSGQYVFVHNVNTLNKTVYRYAP